jgi:hypothetical protein
MSFHRSLVRRKYQWLFTPKTRRKPGPKAPSAELVEAIVEMNAATLDSAAGGSLSRFPLPSALRSTKTSFAGFLPNIFGAIHPAAHPG